MHPCLIFWGWEEGGCVCCQTSEEIVVHTFAHIDTETHTTWIWVFKKKKKRKKKGCDVFISWDKISDVWRGFSSISALKNAAARQQKDTDIWQWLLKTSAEDCEAAAAYSTTQQLPSLRATATTCQSGQMVSISQQRAWHSNSTCGSDYWYEHVDASNQQLIESGRKSEDVNVERLLLCRGVCVLFSCWLGFIPRPPAQHCPLCLWASPPRVCFTQSRYHSNAEPASEWDEACVVIMGCCPPVVDLRYQHL